MEGELLVLTMQIKRRMTTGVLRNVTGSKSAPREPSMADAMESESDVMPNKIRKFNEDLREFPLLGETSRRDWERSLVPGP